jgi:hypothetical protein
VDRLPLVSSCIIQVAQDIDEPWPVEVISHTGVAYNISMVPGDMVLYESHSILHGRPFPLVGRYYVRTLQIIACVDEAYRITVVCLQLIWSIAVFPGKYIRAFYSSRS